MKTVTLTVTLELPDDVTHVAVDADGWIGAYAEKPEMSENGDCESWEISHAIKGDLSRHIRVPSWKNQLYPVR